MGKPRKSSAPPPSRFALQRMARAFAIHLTIAVMILGGLAAAFWFARQQVETKLAYSIDPPQVILVNRPTWMTDVAAEELTRALRPPSGSSAYDASVLQKCARIAASSPWVRRVNTVRRAFHHAAGDTIEVDCEYRSPLALVHWQDYYWLVDNDGFKLPEQYTLEQIPSLLLGNDRRVQLRVIENVQNPPVESGQKWPGDDLAAGLELARLLYGQRYADEIVTIDIANHAGRIDARESQLTLVTRYGSEIRWGRPIGAKDAFVEIPPARKLEALAEVFSKYHRVDANQPWLDIRFDQITYPSPSADTSR